MIWLLLHLACSSRYEGELPNDCNDQADNDKDGLFDCQDNGCTNSPICNQSSSNTNQSSSNQQIDCTKLRENRLNWDQGKENVHTPDGKPFTGKCIAMVGNIIFGEFSYKNGNAHGTWRLAEGNTTVNYKDGKQHGTETSLWSNGQKRIEFKYKDGKQHGTQTMWHQNGKISGKGNFIEGTGTLTIWHENGQKSNVKNYKDGEKHGTQSAWDENGTLYFQATYVNGVKQN